MPEEDAAIWMRWLDTLSDLDKVKIPRCFITLSTEFDSLKQRQLHHFADASQKGYGIITYLRVVTPDESIFCSFVLGKAHLAPIKTMLIPRLELVAATLAAKVDSMLRWELSDVITESIFWTDCLAVQFMIKSTIKRYPVFVANRLSKIEEVSDPCQRRFVDGVQNPADDASRDLLNTDRLKSRWLQGPPFLLKEESEWPELPCVVLDLPPEFKVLRRTAVAVTKTSFLPQALSMNRRFARFSPLYRLKKSVAWILRLCGKLLKQKTNSGPLTVNELTCAETTIIKAVQQEFFPQEVSLLSNSTTPPKGNQKLSDPLQKLNPVCISGVLRVGGRLRRAPIEFETRHPVILPPNSHVTRLLIEQHHQNIGHCGMSLIWTSLRQTFWIIKGAVTVRKVLGQCLLCKRRNATPGKQLMADLPADRVTPSHPPFSFSGIDYFEPFYVKQGRSTGKRYGCVFTCLSMRAVHIELSYSLLTDAFINSLRRFVSRQGKPISIWIDNGTNLVGGHQELKRCLQELNQSRVNEHLRQRQITWNFNPPQASHMGSVWERVI